MGMRQQFALAPFIFAVVVDAATKMVREGVLSDLLGADDLVVMRETIEGLRNKFTKWKKDFKNKGLKVNLRKAKVMVRASITKNDLFKWLPMWNLQLESKG